MNVKILSHSELMASGGVNFHFATVAREPKWFTQNFSIEFQNFTDDLEDLLFASVKADEFVIGLQQYESQAGKGTYLLIESKVKDRKKALEAFKQAFNLPEADVIWKHSSAGGTLVRPFMKVVERNLSESAPLIQILCGSRQVGKTYGMQYIVENWKGNKMFESADTDTSTLRAKDGRWLVEKWIQASEAGNTLLVIDEFQKIKGWSEIIKTLWDKQAGNPQVKLVLLGSNSIYLDKTLTESLAGRYEKIYVPHWDFEEYRVAFNTTLEEYLLFGGYPRAAKFINNYERWFSYISESVIAPVINVDIPFSTDMNKDKILKFLEIVGPHFGEHISYTALAHQLPTATNSDVIKKYFEILEGVYFCQRLPKVTTKKLSRESTPTVIPLFTSFISFFNRRDHFKDDFDVYLKAAVGQRLAERKIGSLGYWKEGRLGVDYVYEHNGQKYALQVGEELSSLQQKSFDNFKEEFQDSKSLHITKERFPAFSKNPDEYLERYAI